MQTIQTLDLEALNAPFSFPRDRRSIFQRDNYAYSYCGVRDETTDLLLIDHATPIDRGGIHLTFNRGRCGIVTCTNFFKR